MYLLNHLARTAKIDLEEESSVRFFIVERGIVKRKFLRALMDLPPVSDLDSSV